MIFQRHQKALLWSKGLSITNKYCNFSQVLVLEPTKVYMPSYLQVNDDDDNKVSTTRHACLW